MNKDCSDEKIWLPVRVLFLSSLILFLTASVSLSAELLAVDITSTTGQTKVELQLDSEIRYSEHFLVGNIEERSRYYIDLYNTFPNGKLPSTIHIDDEHIVAIRIGRHGTMSRLVLDLGHKHGCRMAAKNEAGKIVIQCSSSYDEAEIVTTPPKMDLDQESPNLFYDQSLETFQPVEFPSMAMISPKPLTIGGQIAGFAAYDLKKESYEDQRLSRLRSRIYVQNDSNLQQGLKIKGKVALEWDVLDSDSSYVGSDNDLNLYEAYLKFSGDRWDFSIGRQRVRWGKSDQLSPLDSINPDDLRQFITIDLEERKIPSWLARLRLHGSKFSIESIFMPWFEKSELDYFDSDWALYRNLRQTIVENPHLPQAIKDYALGLGVNENEPSDSLGNSSAAVRLTWQAFRSDFALSYRYGWESLPTIRNFPVKNINFSGDQQSRTTDFLNSADLSDEAVDAHYKRQQIVGFEWETVFDLIGFRGEVAYFDHVSLLSSDLASISKEVVHAVVGIDYTSVDEWYFNLQASWYRIFSYEGDILYFDQDNVSLLGEVSKTLWRGNLVVSTRYNYTLSDGGYYLQPAVTLKYFANFECGVGVMVFGGDGKTMLGSHDQADQFYAKVKLTF